MEHALDQWLAGMSSPLLLLLFAVCVAVLGFSADKLIEMAVDLSIRTGLPRVIIGATIISLGTTMPEAAVSVYAAVRGQPDMALGNAVGSIICDTGLILGLACLISPLPIDRRLVNRQGWLQFSAGVLLVACCIPWSNPISAFSADSRAAMPQFAGWIFVVLLAAYMVWSVKAAKGVTPEAGEAETVEGETSQRHAGILVLGMLIACLFLVASSTLLVGATKVMAVRANVPAGVIAATLVAFGTSLPELVTAMTAVRRGQGELAVGNVIGADILNVLFVAGASASVTSSGLAADENFFRIQFPFMIVVLVLFRIGIMTAKEDRLTRPFGCALLGSYLLYVLLNIPSA